MPYEDFTTYKESNPDKPIMTIQDLLNVFTLALKIGFNVKESEAIAKRLEEE